jgi:hypothetical protein
MASEDVLSAELARGDERGVLSTEEEPKTQNPELQTSELRERLLPAEEIEGEMAADGLKISFVTGNARRTDAARSQGNQHIEGQFPKLVYLVVLTSPHGIQQLAGVDPMRFSGRDNLAPIHQIHHVPTFKPRPRATKQLMHHYSRAANHVWSLEKTNGEAAGSEIVDIDRGVQDG